MVAACAPRSTSPIGWGVRTVERPATVVTRRASGWGSVGVAVNCADRPAPVRTLATGAANARAISLVGPLTRSTRCPALSAPTRRPKPVK